MNLSICKNCEFSRSKKYELLRGCNSDFYTTYHFLNLENEAFFPEAINLNKSLGDKLFDPKKDVLFYFYDFFCGIETYKDNIFWSNKTLYDMFFYYLYEKNILDYFIIKNRKEELLDIEDKLRFLSIDKNNKPYFHKSDKTLDVKERNNVLVGVAKYFKHLEIKEGCPYFFEQTILAEEKNVL